MSKYYHAQAHCSYDPHEIKNDTQMGFYKIIMLNRIYDGLKLKTGLNVAKPSFDIYFTKEDTLAFLDCGPWLRKVTIPSNTHVVKDTFAGFFGHLENKPQVWHANKVIMGEKEKITPKVLSRVITEGADVHMYNDLALRKACRTGHLAIVKVLLRHGANVHADYDRALKYALACGHTEVIEALLEHGANISVCRNIIESQKREGRYNRYNYGTIRLLKWIDKYE